MRMLLLAVLTLSSVELSTSAQLFAQAVQQDSYLDENARELVRQARARRVTTDRRIEAYQTTAVERISVGMSAGIAERLLYRRETASNISWKRNGPVNIEVVGAREVVPPAFANAQVPHDLSRYVPHLAFDPVDSEMLLRFDTTVIRHPLAAGSEAHYRFGTGDSTVIRLPDGRTVRLRELRISPRRRDRHLISGSFWLDTESHAVVQAYFKLAHRITESSQGGGRPRLMTASGEVDYIAIDYGLWDLRWWLPRTVAMRGVMQAGPIRMPMTYERRYDNYVVTGDTSAAPPALGEAPDVETRPCRPPISFTVEIGAGDAQDTTSERAIRARARQAARDSARIARRQAAGAQADSTRICDRQFTVTTLPSSELLNSPLLPPSIYESDAEILTAEELRSIGERVRKIAEPPWQLRMPTVQWGPGGPGLMRYNRVEGLSLGARARLDLGRLETDAELRFGTADREFAGEFGLGRKGGIVNTRIAAYHRLDAVDIATQPLSFGSTLSALLLGSDNDDYFRTSGVELRVTPATTRTQWYDLRLFAEQQRSVEKNTDFSLPNAINSDHDFRDNLEADAADQLGAMLRLRAAHGVDPSAPRLAGEVELHGESGDYALLRPRVLVRGGVPLSRRLTIGAEVEGGTSFGDPTAQRTWQIGGPRTVRGYSAATLGGDTFWRSRLELGVGIAIARIALFGDAAWAGAQEDFENSKPIKAVGIGGSFLDGLLRVDVARALDLNRGWKLHLHLNSIL